jgi:hypothetical protein
VKTIAFREEEIEFFVEFGGGRKAVDWRGGSFEFVGLSFEGELRFEGERRARSFGGEDRNRSNLDLDLGFKNLLV